MEEGLTCTTTTLVTERRAELINFVQHGEASETTFLGLSGHPPLVRRSTSRN